MTAKYVVVTGSVGAGATTVANLLLTRWQADALLEGQIEENNPFFKDAQADPHRWAFASQAHFLAASAVRHAELSTILEASESDFVIEDRTPFEHNGAYASSSHELGYISDREYGLLNDLAREIEKQYLLPDLLIYREMTSEQLVERVVNRGRDGESADAERLGAIHRAFEAFIASWDKTPVVRIPASVDVLSADGERTLLGMLAEHLGQPTR
ncbi:deoxynucleoside kinase [Microbacter sp. GSS18]|nr:deoxynucleoside kinase [Microbacter sp. GSS18]